MSFNTELFEKICAEYGVKKNPEGQGMTVAGKKVTLEDCFAAISAGEDNNKGDIKMSKIFTEEHEELINKQITKAIKQIDFTNMVREAIEREFKDLWEDCELRDYIQNQVVEVMHEHLVKSGLLKK